MDRNKFLMPSPYKVDGGELIGRPAASLDLADLRELGHPESPLKAIRAKCIDCSCFQQDEVRKCVAINCPLWPFRMGHNPFYGKHAEDEAPSPAEGAAAVT